MSVQSSSSSARSTKPMRPLLLAGAFVSVALGLAGCKSEATEYVAAPQPVRAAAVKLTAAEETRSYTGTIKPRYESDLGFRVSGKIVERFINIGDKVTPGMTLAKLDDLFPPIGNGGPGPEAWAW